MNIFSIKKQTEDGAYIWNYMLGKYIILKKIKTFNYNYWIILGMKFSFSRKHKNKISTKIVFPSEAKTQIYENNKQIKKINRLVIFASFSRNGIINPIEQYYIKELKKICDAIIFVADSPILPTELNKIKDYVIYAQFERHEEYDFGSYKRGFEYAQKKGLLNKCNELILCNNSCLGPIFPFDRLFASMHNRQTDFWGLTANNNFYNLYHIQSYFLVITNKVFLSEIFQNFMRKICKQPTIQDVIYNYEIGLSQILLKNGFIADSFVQFKHNEISKDDNNIIFKCKELLSNEVPLLKTYCVKNNEIISMIEKNNPTLAKIIKSQF